MGNYVGTDVTGLADLGNKVYGVYLYDGAANNTIGGVDIGEGNLIAFNDGKGVRINTDTGNDNEIRGNTIHSNTDLASTSTMTASH